MQLIPLIYFTQVFTSLNVGGACSFSASGAAALVAHGGSCVESSVSGAGQYAVSSSARMSDDARMRGTLRATGNAPFDDFVGRGVGSFGTLRFADALMITPTTSAAPAASAITFQLALEGVLGATASPGILTGAAASIVASVDGDTPFAARLDYTRSADDGAPLRVNARVPASVMLGAVNWVGSVGYVPFALTLSLDVFGRLPSDATDLGATWFDVQASLGASVTAVHALDASGADVSGDYTIRFASQSSVPVSTTPEPATLLLLAVPLIALLIRRRRALEL